MKSKTINPNKRLNHQTPHPSSQKNRCGEQSQLNIRIHSQSNNQNSSRNFRKGNSLKKDHFSQDHNRSKSHNLSRNSSHSQNRSGNQSNNNNNRSDLWKRLRPLPLSLSLNLFLKQIKKLIKKSLLENWNRRDPRMTRAKKDYPKIKVISRHRLLSQHDCQSSSTIKSIHPKNQKRKTSPIESCWNFWSPKTTLV